MRSSSPVPRQWNRVAKDGMKVVVSSCDMEEGKVRRSIGVGFTGSPTHAVGSESQEKPVRSDLKTRQRGTRFLGSYGLALLPHASGASGFGPGHGRQC